jgi:hypothetical protein
VDLVGSHHSWVERGMVGARSVCLSGYHRQPFLGEIRVEREYR